LIDIAILIVVFGGFGIGLNIVKSIADEYHLKITVTSKVGEGTSFRVDFPNQNNQKDKK